MANIISLVDVTGQVQASVTSSLDASGSLNVRRSKQRDLYERVLLGTAFRRETGQAAELTLFTPANQLLSFSFSSTNVPLSSSFAGVVPMNVKWMVQPSGFSATRTDYSSSFDASEIRFLVSGSGFQIPATYTVLLIPTRNGSSMGSILTITGSSGQYRFALTASALPISKNDTIGLVIFGTGSNPALTGTIEMQIVTAEISASEKGLVTGSNVGSYSTQLATIPSWTQIAAGKRHAFVISALSSSDHEISSLNAFSSGNLALEQSQIPASASSYYDKRSRFSRVLYKVSSSDAASLFNMGPTPFSLEIAGRSGAAIANSGTYMCKPQWNPSYVEFNVQEYGTIRDIKVWVEFIHDVRTHTGSIGSSSTYPPHGIHSVKVALRSPNTNFYSAHPLLNAPQLSNAVLFSNINNTGSGNIFGNQYHQVPDLLRNSYLLHDGPAIDFASYGTASFVFDNNQSYGLNFFGWNNDIDMRTVFADAASTTNPWFIDKGSDGSIFSGEESLSLMSASAPSAILFSIDRYPVTGSNHRLGQGNNVPWFYDPRVNPGYITGTTNFTGSLTMSPPRGWLTGPASTAGPGEFPTTGSQLGPSMLMPVYPLLDDIIAESLTGLTWNSDADVLAGQYVRASGFRPGLRGTEVHGKWRLMFGVGDLFDQFAGYFGANRAGIWFRQARLEFVIDKQRGPSFSYASKSRRFDKGGYVPRGIGKVRSNRVWNVLTGLPIISFDAIAIYRVQRRAGGSDNIGEYGRSIGITLNTASADFAVMSRLTGSIVSAVTGSMAFFLGNEFGTPFIPISLGASISASFEDQSAGNEERRKAILSRVIRQKPIISSDQNTISSLSRTDYFVKTAERAEELANTNPETSGSSST